MTYTARYRQIREQAAYRRRIAAFGLPALLAPYTATRAPRRPLRVVPGVRRGLSERLSAARRAA